MNFTVRACAPRRFRAMGCQRAPERIGIGPGELSRAFSLNSRTAARCMLSKPMGTPSRRSGTTRIVRILLWPRPLPIRQ
jgi:hypothetical protein